MKMLLGGVVRAVVAAAGGWLVSKGAATTEDMATLAKNADAVIGAATVVATVGWSIWSKVRKTEVK